MRYKHPSYRKSLLHFDFPYYEEVGDGLRDEIGILNWSRSGNAKLVGVEEPVDENVAGTPKFGYRCLQTAGNTDYLSASSSGNVIDILGLDATKAYEFECFVRPTAAAAGNIVAIRDASTDLFTISKDADNKIMVTGLGVTLVSMNAIPLNAFTHILVRLSGGTASIYIGGVASGSVSGLAGSFSATEIRLGGIAGQMDEFMFSHRAGTGTPSVPANPYQGTVDYRTLGGFGDGKHGDYTAAGTSVNINTYAMVSGISGKSVIVGSRTEGAFGDFEAGDEIMIHVSRKQNESSTVEDDLGKYSLRRIAAVSGSTITLNKTVDEFTPAFSNYRIQAIKVPNFNTLTVPEGVILRPPVWDDAKGGGIVAFKTMGNCTINGKILTVLKGPKRTDSLQLTHTDMIDRFVLTGNVFIVSGGMLSAGANARLGGDWDGSGKAGAGGMGAGNYSHGESGMVGHGGKGGRNADESKPDNKGKPGFGGLGGIPNGGSIGGNGLASANVILIGHSVSVPSSAIVTGGGGGGEGGSSGSIPGGGGGAFGGINGGGNSCNGADESGVGKEWNNQPTGGKPAGSGYGGGGGSSLTYSRAQGGGGAGTGFCFIAEAR